MQRKNLVESIVSINANAINDIENITAYQTSAEPFSTNTPLWNSKPTSANFNVPLH
jgi:hypothetical protein